ncbi:TNFAIP3-interacting protein 1 [Scleropages formosus]|uniref:TNFAIP3-interacting protein 1 n=2 Tax=Scleropages formosus TaxID=113540 RepID=A0A8C9S470_SCLFO|nr:TNFAIP3-interacting protein 1 [Scleropages formosus]XP_018600723.1 TNFAIP3-interacting protein 1 [Scleropages formosus]
MEGKGPYRIYDPGGNEAQAKEEVSSSSYQQLLEENSVLRERMKGLKSLGDLLEESQTEASRLRQRVEELVRDNEALRSSSSFSSGICLGLPVQAEAPGVATHGSSKAEVMDSPKSPSERPMQPNSAEASSEFEVVNLEEKGATIEDKLGKGLQLPQDNLELASQLQKLESSFSLFAEESNPNQLLAHLGRMALEFNRLSSKVQKNEQRTSLLQTLCEQLRQENNELRKKMEEDLQYRNQDLEQLRQENLKLRKLVTGAVAQEVVTSPQHTAKQEQLLVQEAAGSKVDVTATQQGAKAVEKGPAKTCDPEVYEKKIKLLEKQRKDVLEVNKQWDIQWNSMKVQYEQKITELRQRLSDSQKAVAELEAEREQRQRDYDKKLLLAKSKIENVQGEKDCLTSETCELKHKLRYLQDQLVPLSKQREYQDKEIQRLNRALEEALNLHSPSTGQQALFGNHAEGASNLQRQDLLTQITVLKEQVKIFEEDFQKERSDRERMNEEKEDLRRQVERLQGQITNLTNQLHQAQSECQKERAERCRLERLNMNLKQGQHERRTSDPTSGAANAPMSPPYCGHFVPANHQGFEGWPLHFPTRVPNLGPQPGRDFPPFQPGFPWQPPCPQQRSARGPVDTARPPPENTADPTAAGCGKRDRPNIDPGKH